MGAQGHAAVLLRAVDYPWGGGGVAGEGEQGKCACIVMSILKLYGWVSRSSFRVVIRCLEVTHA